MSLERSASHRTSEQTSRHKSKHSRRHSTQPTNETANVIHSALPETPRLSEKLTESAVDNIDESAESLPMTYPTTEVYNCTQACHAVGIKTGVKRISMLPSPQMTDGSLIEFMDTDKKEIIATGRLRLTNKLHIDKASGNMALFTVVGDLVFERPSITVELEKEVARL